MCFKYATPKLEELVAHLEGQPPYTIEEYNQYYLANGFDLPFYMPVTTNKEPRIVGHAIWGLVPEYIHTSDRAKEISKMTLNAKSETVFKLPSFRDYIGSKRCLIWTGGFFESQWEVPGKESCKKTPYFIYMKNRAPFSFGGLYSEWARPDTGEILTTYSIITTPANNLLAEIHNNKKRMPLIIPSNKRDQWLSELSKDEINSMMQPLPDGLLAAHTVSKLANARGVDLNIPEVQEPYEYPRDTLF